MMIIIIIIRKRRSRRGDWSYFREGYSDGVALHQTVIPRAARLDAGRNANLRNGCDRNGIS